MHLLALYDSIVGHVFDVSKGAEFYAPGNGYDFFAFRDGSRAFVTGTFTEVNRRKSAAPAAAMPPGSF